MSHTRQLAGFNFHIVGAENEAFMGTLATQNSGYFASLLSMRVYNIM